MFKKQLKIFVIVAILCIIICKSFSLYTKSNKHSSTTTNKTNNIVANNISIGTYQFDIISFKLPTKYSVYNLKILPKTYNTTPVVNSHNALTWLEILDNKCPQPSYNKINQSSIPCTNILFVFNNSENLDTFLHDVAGLNINDFDQKNIANTKYPVLVKQNVDIKTIKYNIYIINAKNPVLLFIAKNKDNTLIKQNDIKLLISTLKEK